MERITEVVSLAGAIQHGGSTVRDISLELLSCMKKKTRRTKDKRNKLKHKRHHEFWDETAIQSFKKINPGMKIKFNN